MQRGAAYSNNGYEGHVEVQLEQIEVSKQLRTVKVDRKIGKPLGFTIKEDAGRLFVGRLVSGTACDNGRDEKLRVGDRLAAVNGIKLDHMSLDEACNQLQNLSGTLEFTVESVLDSQQPAANGNVILRALFNYNPDTDYLHPCKQLGLKFKTGDIIHVVNSADPNWWQGYLDHDEAKTTRIFISPAYQKQTAQPPFENLPFYERQQRLSPTDQLRRPLVLVGPPGCDHNELWIHLIESHPDKFAAPVDHTTRSQRADEQPGLDYWFLDDRQFRRLEAEHEFIETRTVDGFRFGTSVKSIQKVSEDGLMCVLTLQPESLPTLRYHSSRLMPYVVFLKLPNQIDQLNRRRQRDLAHHYDNQELSCMQALENKLLSSSLRWVDTVLDNASPEETVRRLVQLTERAGRESQWVPASWLHTEPLRTGELVDTVF